MRRLFPAPDNTPNKYLKLLVVLFFSIFNAGRVYAQLPAVSYNSPQTYTVGTVITPLLPSGSGVDAPGYNNLIWGSGFNRPYGVAVDAAANVYVADTYNQAVKKIPAGGGTPVVIYSGYACAGIAVDAAGNVYVANINLSTLDKIPAGGGAAVNLGIGLTNPMGVAVDAAGNIYVSTGSDNSVHKIPPAGGVGTVIASGFTQVGGVAIDAAGNLYIADTGADGIFKLPAGASQAVKIATVTKPVGIALDGGGNIYAGDITDNTVVEIPANGGAQVANSTGYAQPGFLACDTFGNVFIPYGGTSTVLEMQVAGGYYTGGLPQGLFINRATGAISGTPAAGSNAADYKVRAYNSNGSATSTVNIKVTGSGLLSGLTIGSATLIPAFAPATANYTTTVNASQQTLTITPSPADASATIAVIKGVDTTLVSSGSSASVPLSVGSNPIKILITPVNGASFAYALTASRPSASAPTLSYSSPQVYPVGAPIPALSPTSSNVFGFAYAEENFNAPNIGYPYGVATDAAGNVYVADAGGALKKYPPGGGTPVEIGPGGCLGVAVDAAGNVYAAVGSNIIKITPGGLTTTVASGLQQPVGVAVDRAGNIYTADYQGQAIYKIPADGSARVTLVSGSLGVFGIAVNASGNVFFTNAPQNKLYMITTDGQVTEYRSDLKYPTGVSIDGAGNIFVTNNSNYKGSTIELIPADGGNVNFIGTSSIVNGAFASAVDVYGNVYVACNLKNIAIRRLRPTGGYLANGGLPPGLTINTSNGVITGTPTVATAAANYVVTAYNTSGGVSAVINFKIMGVATLSGLGISSGAFLAPFSPNITTYSLGVSNDQKLFYVQPTATDKSATIKVNGQAVVSGAISQGIPLAVGSNTISIVVTTVDGIVKTYTLSVGRAASFASYPGPQTWYKNMPITAVMPVTNGAGIAAPGYYSTILASGLSRPGKLSVDKVGNIYFCDDNNLKKIPADGSAIVNISTGIGILTGVDVDAAGNIYLPDLVGGKIKKISVTTGAISVIVSGLNGPSDVVVDAAGNVFFVEEGANSIKKLPVGGGSITTIATVKYPVALAMDASGNFYVIDGYDLIVFKVPAAGGSPVNIGSGFYRDLAVDASGNVYLTEASGSWLKMIPAKGGATINVLPYTGQTEADGVTIDASGNIYYSNYFSQTPAATVTKSARVGGYAAIDTLPAGVAVNDTTGVISGTPLTGSLAKNYNIIGYNSLGGNLAAVNIGVKSSYLTGLATNNGSLSPAFSIATAGYTTTVCNATNTLTVTPAAAEPTAVITVNGTVVASGTASGTIPLNVGVNTITVTSITTDTSTYTLAITRLPGPGVAITGAFCQSCSPQTLTFTAKVTNGGPTSTYTWYKNNIVVGTNDSTYVDNALVGNDKIWCTVVSTATCVLTNTITSNVVTLAAPAIVSMSPSSGPPGTLVSINGSNFETLTALTIAGTPAIPVSNTGTNIMAMIMPAGTTGPANATTIYGTAAGGAFTVMPGVPPGVQQGGKTVAANGLKNLGRVVAISADGNTAISNATVTSGGGAIVFTRNNGTWIQQATLLGTGATGSASQGSSVALSADGNTAIIGGQNDNNGQGAIWVFVRSNGIWAQRGSKLTGSDAASGSPGSSFGSAVSLSADGGTALIGGTTDNSYSGAVWIFNRDASGNWAQNGSKLTATGNSGLAMLGNAVALSADGNTAIAGGHNEGGRAGGVWVFVNNNGTWAPQDGKLLGTGTTGITGAEQGTSVAISADGNTAFWGGFHDNSSIGACWVFTRSGGVWTQQGAKLVGAGIVTSPGKTIINFGQSVGLSADGNTAVAGAPNDNNFTGAMWVFTRSNGAWSQHGSKLTGAGEIIGTTSLAALGQSVALTPDGSTAMAGDPADNASTGGIWTFVPISPVPLSGLLLSSGTLAPAFDPATTIYTASVGSSVGVLALTPAVSDITATITINGIAAPSGTTTANFTLAVGANQFTIVTTAIDGLTTKTYTLTVTRADMPPNIAYNTPNTYATGIPVTLLPTNSGGAVPVTIYRTVSTLAGSGASGSANGTGAAATFKGLMNMVTDAAGNIYVADYMGNVIRKITPAGVATTFAGSGAAGNADGTGTAATFNAPFGLATDATGTIYVGDSGNNLIRKITPAGVVTTFAGSGVAGNGNGTGTAAKFNNPRGLVTDRQLNLYVADYGNNTIRKITPAGIVTIFAGSGVAGLANGAATTARFKGPIALSADTLGNVYVADYVNNVIRKIAPGGVVTTFAGSSATGNVDGTGTAASFKSPYALATDGDNNIYVADASNNLIRKITPAGIVTTLAGSGAASGTNGIGIAAAFNVPHGVAADGLGNLYVSDYTGRQVRKVILTGYTISQALPAGLTFNVTSGIISGTPTAVNTATNYTVAVYNATGGNATTVNIAVNAGLAVPNISYPTPQILSTGILATVPPANSGGAVPATIYSTVSTLAGSGTSGSADGTGAAATFKGLMNMTTDAAGNIYAADYTGNLIRKITPAGVATTFAGSGAAGNANGTGTEATFNGPAGVAIDAEGTLYVGDAGNNLIRKITPGGVVTTFAGSGVAGNTNGTGTAAKFNNPHGLATDVHGNVYVADYGNNVIRKITPAGAVTTLAGSGVAGAANGTGTAASFRGPVSLRADSSGNVYVADYGNNIIRKITPGAVVSTFAGSGIAGLADGTGTAASFKTPYAIATDRDNNIYVADAGNNLVRKITPAGIVTTLAGDGTAGSTNGVGTAAKFNAPRGLAFYQGNLYVGDYTTHLLRKIILTGYAISPALPAGLNFNSATGIISGKPAVTSVTANYTVMAYNATGGNSAIVNLTVNAGLAAPNITYATPQMFTVGTAANVSPTNSGGAVPATVYATVSTLAGSGASGSADGTGAAATFKGLMNMATDAAGNVYVADYLGNVIRRITPAGVASTFAGSGVAGNTNGTGTAATFNGPLGIASDAEGTLYVGDSGNNLIRKITPDGVVTTFAGSGAAGSTNGTSIAASFNGPKGLVIDGQGNIYVADMANNRIRKITSAGVVTTFAGSGAAGSANGTGIAATFNGPISLGIDGTGNIYVADFASSIIRKITAAAVVSTFAGNSVAGNTDGTGTVAKFKNPYAITTDRDNNIYAADAGNNLIRKITPAGLVTTLAGSGTAGSTGGAGTAAKFNAPHGVAFYQGTLYVADYAGHQVRKVILTGYAINPSLPAGLTFSGTTGVISGTPTATNAAANYTVTAYNATGGGSTTINITVNAMGGMALAHPDVPQAAPISMDLPSIRQGVSPNGDGINDVLIIDNIERYPENEIIIMNRSGGLAYQVKGYNNVSIAFDGHSNKNGKLQQAGTYFYRLEYKDKGGVKSKTGFILLKY